MTRHHIRLGMLFVTGCVCGPVAMAGDTEQLSAEIPAEWVKVIDRKVGSLHVAEYYPSNSGVEWQQKLSIEALSGAGLPDPLVFVQGLAEEQREVCNRFDDNSVFAGFENGYPSVVHIMQCGESTRTGKSLVTMIKVIKGNTALYTVTRIWRFAADDKPPSGSSDAEAEPSAIPINDAELGAWSQSLRQIKVCDTALPAHPCPDRDEHGRAQGR